MHSKIIFALATAAAVAVAVPVDSFSAANADKSTSNGGDVGQSVDGLIPIDVLNILSDNAVSLFVFFFFHIFCFVFDRA